jgi:NADPH:quinone reductase-like Zn-dependent oxidoreductase
MKASKTQDQLFMLTKPGGIVVSSVVRPNEQLASQYGVRSDYFIVDVNNPQLAEIAGKFENKQLTIPIGSVLQLSQARAAHEMMAGSRPHLRGKIVLAVDG